MSPNIERLLGYATCDWTDLDSWLEGILEEDRDFARFYCEGETQAGRDHVFEYRMRKKNGDVLWVLDIVRLIKDTAGKPCGLAGFIVNISDRKGAEAALHHSEERYRTMFEAAPEGVCLFDDSLLALKMNRRFAKMLGYGDEEIQGCNLLEFVADDQREQFRDQQARIGGSRQELEVELLHKDGFRIPVLFSTTALPEPGQFHTSTDIGGKAALRTRVAFVTDLGKQKHTELTLRRVHKMEAIGQLTGGIAHDFNNILAIIQGNLELLELELPEEKEAHIRLDSLRRVTRRAISLTQQLLDFSRTHAKHASVCNLNRIIEETSVLMARSLTPGIEVQYRLAPELWLTRVDPGEFQDTLMNLVINARDAMKSGGTLVISTCNLSATAVGQEDICAELAPGDYVCVSVEDSGVGMPSNVLEHIFEPFYTTKERGKGTGLGLSMVFGFVQRSGGQIEVRSVSGTGSRFIMYLPQVQELLIPAETSLSQAQFNTFGKETILVVDDEEALLELVQRRLEGQGYRVLLALDGSSALSVLKVNPHVDLLFTDVVMPGGLNGYQLAERATTLQPGIKVLLTTGFTDLDINKPGVAGFAPELLRKPYSQKDMVETVRALLDKIA